MRASSLINKNRQHLKFVLTQRPIEILLIIVFFVFALFFDINYYADWLFFPIIFVAVYLVRRQKWCYWLSPVVFLIMLALLNWKFHNTPDFYLEKPEYWGALSIAFICFLSEGWDKDNYRYVSKIIDKKINLLILAPLATGLFFMAIITIAWSIDYLFGFNLLLDKTWIETLKFSIWGLIPFFFLLFEQRLKERQNTINHFVEIAVNFILSPVLIIYSLTLYLYLGKIALAAELPRGNVPLIVLPYLFAAVGLSALQTILQKSKWQVFYHFLPYILFAPLALLWLGISEGIATYSFTEARIYLVAIAITITIFCIFSLWKKFVQYRYLAFIGIAVIFVTTYVIDPKQIEFDSQHTRFKQRLSAFNLLDGQGKIKSKAEVIEIFRNLTEAEKDKFLNLSVFARHLYSLDNTIAEQYKTEIFDSFLEFNHQEARDYYQADYITFAKNNQLLDVEDYKRVIVFTPEQYLKHGDERGESQIIDGYQVLTTFDGDKLIRNILQKNGFELGKRYTTEELENLNVQFTQVETEEGLLVFRDFSIHFDEEQGYIFHEANVDLFLQK